MDAAKAALPKDRALWVGGAVDSKGFWTPDLQIRVLPKGWHRCCSDDSVVVKADLIRGVIKVKSAVFEEAKKAPRR